MVRNSNKNSAAISRIFWQNDELLFHSNSDPILGGQVTIRMLLASMCHKLFVNVHLAQAEAEGE
jgi:hypothetical protein